MKRKLLPALVLTLLSGTVVAAGYEGSGTSTSKSGSGGMTSGSSSDRMSDHDTSMKRSGDKHHSGSMDDKRPMSRSDGHTSAMGSLDAYHAQRNIPNEDRIALKTMGINVTPNIPVGDPGRLNPSEQPATSRQNQEVQADENRELQTILKQAGIHLTPNRPTGAPGMLNSSVSNNSGGNAGLGRENMEKKTRMMRVPGIGFNGKITV